MQISITLSTIYVTNDHDQILAVPTKPVKNGLFVFCRNVWLTLPATLLVVSLLKMTQQLFCFHWLIYRMSFCSFVATSIVSFSLGRGEKKTAGYHNTIDWAVLICELGLSIVSNWSNLVLYWEWFIWQTL